MLSANLYAFPPLAAVHTYVGDQAPILADDAIEVRID